MYGFVRFAAGASLTAFGCIIAAGALMLVPPMIEKVRVARTEGSPPTAVQCEHDCPAETASLRDLPTTAPEVAPSIAPDIASRFAGYGGAFSAEAPAPFANTFERPAAEQPPAASIATERAPQSELSAPDRTTAASPPDAQQRPVARRTTTTAVSPPEAPRRPVAKPTTTAVSPPPQRRLAKPRIKEQANLPAPAPQKPAQRTRAAKRPGDDALRAVRRFGDGLQDIPVNSFAPDGRQRTIVIRPTSVQDVYYYSVPR